MAISFELMNVCDNGKLKVLIFIRRTDPPAYCIDCVAIRPEIFICVMEAITKLIKPLYIIERLWA
jgi:hypothetical protein